MNERPSVDIRRIVKLTTTTDWLDDWPEYDEPGKAALFVPTEEGCVLQHTCPGCGKFGAIGIGFTTKPESPSWLLQSGDKTDPTTWTLSPSIHCIGCCGWHGWLKEGTFTV